MSANPFPAQDEESLILQINNHLANPAHLDNPLREPLSQLLGLYQDHQTQLNRLIKISDGFHDITRNRHQTLAQQYDRQVRHLEKLARISDRYQNSLRELSQSLKDASLHDPMTGLGNRRFLMDQLMQETERANRKNTTYSLGILDVDHFKTINDRFGHEAGDITLCTIARAIESALREYDLCGRWGGEEFLIMMPETQPDFALQIAERVCLGIKSIQLKFLDYCISASVGLTVYRHGESYSETINRADSALLQAKSAGRNRIEIV